MVLFFLCLVHMIHVAWNNPSNNFLFKTQWYQWFHTRHILIGIFILSSIICSTCHRVCGYFYFCFLLMRTQRVSRGTTRTRDVLNKRQGETDFKWIQSEKMVYILFIFSQPTSIKKHPPWMFLPTTVLIYL